MAKRTKDSKHEARMSELLDVARASVASGSCPECGAKLRRNLAIAGWFQCGRFGTDNFRAPEYVGDPACTFQAFTER